MNDLRFSESRGFVTDYEIAVVLQAPVPQAIERVVAHGAVEIGQRPGERFDPVSVTRAVNDLAAEDEAQPLAAPILGAHLSGQIQVHSTEVRAGRIPSLEELLARLVAVQQELAGAGRVWVAHAF